MQQGVIYIPADGHWMKMGKSIQRPLAGQLNLVHPLWVYESNVYIVSQEIFNVLLSMV